MCALLAWYALLEHGQAEEGASKPRRRPRVRSRKFWLEDNAARKLGEAAERLARRVVALAAGDRLPLREQPQRLLRLLAAAAERSWRTTCPSGT